jgi:hypothetical protein
MLSLLLFASVSSVHLPAHHYPLAQAPLDQRSTCCGHPSSLSISAHSIAVDQAMSAEFPLRELLASAVSTIMEGVPSMNAPSDDQSVDPSIPDLEAGSQAAAGSTSADPSQAAAGSTSADPLAGSSGGDDPSSVTDPNTDLLALRLRNPAFQWMGGATDTPTVAEPAASAAVDMGSEPDAPTVAEPAASDAVAPVSTSPSISVPDSSAAGNADGAMSGRFEAVAKATPATFQAIFSGGPRTTGAPQRMTWVPHPSFEALQTHFEGPISDAPGERASRSMTASTTTEWSPQSITDSQAPPPAANDVIAPPVSAISSSPPVRADRVLHRAPQVYNWPTEDRPLSDAVTGLDNVELG